MALNNFDHFMFRKFLCLQHFPTPLRPTRYCSMLKILWELLPGCCQWALEMWCTFASSLESIHRCFFSQKHLQRISTLKDRIILQLQFSAICELPASVTLRPFCLLKQLYEVQSKKLNSHFISHCIAWTLRTLQWIMSRSSKECS